MRSPVSSGVLFLILFAGPAGAQTSNADLLPRRTGFLAPRELSSLREEGLGGVTKEVWFAGDLDHDGLADLIAAPPLPPLPAASTLEVHRNLGELDFELHGTIALVAQARLRPGALADLTGDGSLDLVFARVPQVGGGGTPGFEVHRGRGDGTFLPPLFVAAPRPLDLVVGDVDADGGAEIAIQHAADAVVSEEHLRWWDWDGNTFTSSPPLGLGNESLFGLLAADVDDDGHEDLVGTVSAVDGMPVERYLRLFPSVGGTPTPGGSVTFARSIMHPSGTPTVLVGDLERDGDDDFVVASNDTGTLLVQRGIQEAPGSFVRSNVQQVPASSPLFLRDFAALVDLDWDGDLDFVREENGLFMLENLGPAFGAPVTRWYPPEGGLVLAADLDGDRRRDLVGTDTVLQGRGSFDVYGRRIAVAYSGSFDRIADLEGDGDEDLLGVGTFRDTLRNDGTGTMTRVASGMSQEPVGLGDFDGDGLREYLVNVFDRNGYANTILAGDNGAGVYTYQQTVTGGVRIEAGLELWPTADVDGNGHLDLVAEDGWWLNAGPGVQPRFAPVSGYVGLPLAVADVDADGDPDIVVDPDGDPTAPGGVHLLRNDGSGGFVPEAFFPMRRCRQADFLDLDEDGDLDVALVLGTSSSVNEALAILENVDGALIQRPTLEVPGHIHSSVAASDVDLDGRVDLLVAYGSDRVRVHFRSGEGPVYGPVRTWVWRDEVRGFFDVDGDGDLDGLADPMLVNQTFHGARAGRIRQYGDGTPGTGGLEPVLGASGPVRPREVGTLRVRRGLGGALGFLLLGDSSDSTPWPSRPSVVQLVGGVHTVLPLVLSGPASKPGRGEADLPLSIKLGLAGREIFHQAIIEDPAAPEGWSATNGLAIRFGVPRQPPTPMLSQR